MHIDDAALRADLAATARGLSTLCSLAAKAAQNGSDQEAFSTTLSELCSSAISSESAAGEVAILLDAAVSETFEIESLKRRKAAEAGALASA